MPRECIIRFGTIYAGSPLIVVSADVLAFKGKDKLKPRAKEIFATSFTLLANFDEIYDKYFSNV